MGTNKDWSFLVTTLTIPFIIMSTFKFSKTKKAICILIKNNNQITGKLYLFRDGEQTRVQCEINGLMPGKHGLHVHTSADISNGCESTCNHYNPSNKKHGGPLGNNRHKGDFGNIFANEKGECKDLIIADVTLDEIIGRTFVIHEHEDDLGRGSNEESLKTGNSGKRVACGIIGHV
jgi:Cu-Zn family superoxide dismutase